jgi:4-diphosphocytidyl-2-C-methyl-D-erythritol kinase
MASPANPERAAVNAAPSVVRRDAPAKINLHLRVGPRASDGFHPLLSWMVACDLRDTLEFRTAGSGLHLTSDHPGLPCDATNLVMRAAEKLAAAIGATVSSAAADGRSPGMQMHLVKRIPAGGGLGGGSSDAAATLIALNEIWNGGLARARLADLATELGSDVPFFLHGPSSICRGRGEIVRPVSPPAARWALLIVPEFPMPTAAVYRRFDELALGRKDDIEREPPWPQWAAEPARRLLPLLRNDLEIAAMDLEPRLRLIRDQIEAALDRPVLLSGSGSTLFTLFDSHGEAEKAARSAPLRSELRYVIVEICPAVAAAN